MSEHDELAKRVSELERDLAEAKKALEALKPKEPFRPRMTMQPTYRLYRRHVDEWTGVEANG